MPVICSISYLYFHFCSNILQPPCRSFYTVSIVLDELTNAIDNSDVTLAQRLVAFYDEVVRIGPIDDINPDYEISSYQTIKAQGQDNWERWQGHWGRKPCTIPSSNFQEGPTGPSSKDEYKDPFKLLGLNNFYLHVPVILKLQLGSPARLAIKDSLGNFAGDSSGQRIDRIGNTFYFSYSDSQYLNVYDPRFNKYVVSLEGKDNGGIYHLEISLIQNGEVKSTYFFTGRIIPGQKLSIPISLVKDANGIYGIAASARYDAGSLPLVEKKNAKTAVVTYLSDGNRKIKDVTNKATEYINRSLAAEFWQSNDHLTLKGKTVFENEKKAVHELMKVLTLTSVRDSALSAINHLVTADDILATIAINDAITAYNSAGCVSSSTNTDCKYIHKKIQDGWEEMIEAQVDYSSGDYDKAIEHYKNGWQKAQEAMKKTLPGSSEELSDLTDIEVPLDYMIYQNYPNPFNPSTTIHFEIPEPSHVKLEIFNTLGQVVGTLIDEDKAGGYYDVNWQANLTSGLYYYRIEAIPINDQSKSFRQVNKMILLK